MSSYAIVWLMLVLVWRARRLIPCNICDAELCHLGTPETYDHSFEFQFVLIIFLGLTHLWLSHYQSGKNLRPASQGLYSHIMLTRHDTTGIMFKAMLNPTHHTLVVTYILFFGVKTLRSHPNPLFAMI